MSSTGAPGSDLPAGVERPRLRPQQTPWITRFGKALKLLATFLIVPLVIGGLLGPKGAGMAATLGAVLVLGSSLVNGRAATRFAVPFMLLAAALGALTKPDWPWVLVVAAFAALSGLATRYGAGMAASMATLQAVTAPPVDRWQTLAVLMAFTTLGALYGWMMAGRVGAPKVSPAPPTTARYATTMAVALGLATALAASIAVATDWSHATWMVAAVVVLGIPTPGLTEKLMAQRMIGQLIACAVVTVMGVVSQNEIVLLFAAVVMLTLYFMSLGRPMYEQVAYLSAFFMLPAVATTSGSVLAVQRIAYNLAGLGILLLVLFALKWARQDETEDAMAVVTASVVESGPSRP